VRQVVLVFVDTHNERRRAGRGCLLDVMVVWVNLYVLYRCVGFFQSTNFGHLAKIIPGL
jgi:hypothetical protein